MSSRNLRHSRQVPCSEESSGVFQLRRFKLAACRFRHVAIWRDPFLGGRSHSRFTVSALASLSSRPRDHRSPHRCVRVPGRQTLDEPEVRDLSSGTSLLRALPETPKPLNPKPLNPKLLYAPTHRRMSCASEGWTGAETACISTTALRPVLRRQIRQEQEHMLSRTPAPMATSWSESGVPA